MSIIISNLRIGLDDTNEEAYSLALHRLGITADKAAKLHIVKKSLDARRRPIAFVVTVSVDLNHSSAESEIVKAISDPFVRYNEKKKLIFTPGTVKSKLPVSIVGFGPAGIFAAYLLAKMGYSPVVYERGGTMEKRIAAIDTFWRDAKLDTETNIQFGEGGAGTFSDGKLTTRISDSFCDYVLEALVENGAPLEILETAKPHIGTDKLRSVITNMRFEIEKNGGKICFDSHVENIKLANGKVCSITVNGNEVETDTVIMAIGHSARDTFSMLLNQGIAIENKPFSVGVRIEQPQAVIEQGLYGDLAGHKGLPRGEYQLSQRCKDRCVYSFCMCPGGAVVPASSEENGVVTNGMSQHARDGENANSALVVSVDERDFGTTPLAGMLFQRELEQRAFLLGGGNYRAPASTVASFMGIDCDKSNDIEGKIEPSYALGVTQSNLHDLFPKEISKLLRLGLQSFEQKLRGFSAPSGILTGVETRTSSPIRILRDNETLQSINAQGLYPCGEGSGYAGGIVSAAVDGLHVAEKIISRFSPD